MDIKKKVMGEVLFSSENLKEIPDRVWILYIIISILIGIIIGGIDTIMTLGILLNE